MRGSIADQEEMTRLGLELMQVSANKAALENMCREQKEEIERAQAQWVESKQLDYDPRTALLT